MIVFPNCKINLGLHILQKRADGYHDLQTVFYPLPLFDALEVIPATSYTPVTFSSSGITIEAANTCTKAYELLKKDYPQIPSIQLHLHKAIPIGAGLGGGSADGAFMLQVLNKQFKLELSEEALLQYALLLGSDAPFFIKNKPCLATGRGEILTKTQLDLSVYKFVVVNPGIHINTGWAFSQLTPKTPEFNLSRLFETPIPAWEELVINDFEEPVFKAYPEIETIKKYLYGAGALYASLSGSGSTVYGIFEKTAMPTFSFPSHYYVKVC